MISLSNELTTLINGANAYQNLSVPQLVEKTLKRGEGILTNTGAVAVKTGKYTGRSPNDKFIVDEVSVQDEIDWGTVNKPISKEAFERLYIKLIRFLKEKEEIFVFKGYAGADPNYRMPIQVVNELAWHNLFARHLFVRSNDKTDFKNPFTILSAPSFKADPEVDGTNSEAFIIISFEKRIVLIGGTEYAGEMKKAIFSVMNFLLPKQNILPMHCSANVGEKGDVALFFGLSGTGKTTLSADPDRPLIGDDEHGWSSSGIFNIEGGCYAKCIGLSIEKEPQIFNAIGFGSVLENVVVDGNTRLPDYHDSQITENTRAAYPIEAIGNFANPSMAGHANTIIFLTADAFGVLPPISKLTKEQAIYHFLSGYTSKLAGTERGVTSPKATFSSCFGAPFLPRPAAVYAEMLGKRIEQHNVNIFLVNTGWTGGEYGVGKRIQLSYTRAMVQAALAGKLDEVETVKDPIFGLNIPVSVPNVPNEVLKPEKTWADPKAYEQKALQLAKAFQENFKKFKGIPKEIEITGGPQV